LNLRSHKINAQSIARKILVACKNAHGLILEALLSKSLVSKFRVAWSLIDFEFYRTKFSKMSKFKIVPLSKEYATKIRNERKDDFGNEVLEQIATGKGPCRISLKPFKVGEDTRLLLSHSPFTEQNIFNQPGPIFINKEEVEPYSDVHRFPLELKNNKESFPLSLIGYDNKQEMIFTQLVGNNDVDLLIEKIFEGYAKVEYLHVRNSKACCYICKVERCNE